MAKLSWLKACAEGFSQTSQIRVSPWGHPSVCLELMSLHDSHVSNTLSNNIKHPFLPFYTHVSDFLLGCASYL